MKAFVLGAGLGTRLRPLTEDRPKPMVPLGDYPLILFAMAHLASHGVGEFVVNTHHLPEAYTEYFQARDGRAEWAGRPVTFRHEPLLLDTAGGLKNCEDVLTGTDFALHNGDVVACLDLAALWKEHRERDNIATLALRSKGGPLHVGWDPASRRVLDIRGKLGRSAPSACLYTGIAAVSPRIFSWIPAGQPFALTEVLLRLCEAGERVGGILLDEGMWMDLGSLEAYKGACRALATGHLAVPALLAQQAHEVPKPDVEEGAWVGGFTLLGAGCRVGRGARLRDCILWPRAEVAAGVSLRDCIVRRSAAISAESAIL